MRALTLLFVTAILRLGAQNLLVEYRMVNCDGSTITATTLPDCSGNAHNATFANHGGSGAPTPDATGVAFNGNYGQTADMPAGTLSTAVTFEIFADYSNNTTVGGTYPILGSVSNGFSILSKANTDTTSSCYVWAGSFGDHSTEGFRAPWGPTMCTVVLDATADKIYTNGVLGKGYRINGPHGNLSTTRTGVFQLGGSSAADVAAYFTGHIYYFRAYDGVLSAQKVAADYAEISKILQARGVTRFPANSSVNNTAVFLGDSLTNGTGTGIPYSTYVAPTGTWDKWTFGSSGATAAQVDESIALAQQKYAPGASKNVAVLWAGTNQVSTESAISTWHSLADAALRLRRAGFQVLLPTMISRTGSCFGGSCDALKNQLNALILAHGPQIADGVVNMTGNASLSADGAYSNNTYFTDGIHLTVTGYQAVAALVTTAINGLPAPASWYDASWKTRKAWTVNSRRVYGPLDDFPLLLKIDADSDLAGHLVSDCHDFLPTLDGAKLDYQILTCDATAGTVHAFARIPFLSNTQDTRLLIYYGNSGASDQSNAAGVWDANTKVALPGGSATDSTRNGTNATAHGSLATAPGPFGSSYYANGSNAYLTTATAAVTSAYTLDVWYKADVMAGSTRQMIAGVNNGSFGIGWSSSEPFMAGATLGLPLERKPNTSRWIHQVLTWDGATVTVYVNGMRVKTAPVSSLGSFTGGLQIGGDGSNFFLGWIGAVRLSNTARSRAWVGTEYANQAFHDLFFSVGPAETNTAAAPAVSFAATYPNIEASRPTLLEWRVAGATSISIDNGVGGRLPAAGSIKVNPKTTTTYTITATNATGTTTATQDVTILSGTPVAYLRASGPPGVVIHDYEVINTSQAAMNAMEPHNLVPGDYLVQFGNVSTDSSKHYASNLNGHFIVKDALDDGTYIIGTLDEEYITPNAAWIKGDTNGNSPGANWAGRATPFPLAKGVRGFLGGTMANRIAVEPASLVVSGGAATANLGYNHDIQVGDTISVWNTTASGNLNGEHAVTAVGANTITFATNSSSGTYTANKTCGPSAGDPHTIGGTENCVRISQYAISSNPLWAGILAETNYSSAADYKHVYDGGTCTDTCPAFVVSWSWKLLESSYRFLVDRKNKTQLDAVVYATNNVERLDAVGWPANPGIGADEGGDQAIGHYGFQFGRQMAMFRSAAGNHLTASEKTTFAKKMLNDLWMDPNAQCTLVFPDYETIASGAARGGDGTHITLAASDSAATDFYAGNIILREHVADATCGADCNWYGTVTAYNSTTKVATISNPRWIQSRGSAALPVAAASWPVPANGSGYRVLATATLSGNTVTGVNTHFTTDFSVGDGILLQQTWGNMWPENSAYVSAINSDTSITIIKGRTAMVPAPSTPTQIFIVPKYSVTANHCGFHWRMQYTSGWQGARPIMYVGGGNTTALDYVDHAGLQYDQNVGSEESAWDVMVGAVVADDDPRGLLYIEKGQSYQWDSSYRFNLAHRGGFTPNGIWYGMDNDVIKTGLFMTTMRNNVPMLPMPGMDDEFLKNIAIVKQYLPLPDQPRIIQMYGANNADTSLPGVHAGMDWIWDFWQLTHPTDLAAKYLNKLNTDLTLYSFGTFSAGNSFPWIDPRRTSADYKVQPLQYFFSSHTQTAACNAATGRSPDFRSCDWGHGDSIISKSSWSSTTASQAMFEGRSCTFGYDICSPGELKVEQVGRLLYSDRYGAGDYGPPGNVSEVIGMTPQFNNTLQLRSGYPQDAALSQISRWASAGNGFYGDSSSRYWYAMADMTGATAPTYNRQHRHVVEFKKPSTPHLIVQFDDIDASNRPPSSIRIGIHYAQNGETAQADKNLQRFYDEGTTTCSATANCDNAHTGITLAANDIILSHENGHASDSAGPARVFGVNSISFSPGTVTRTWDGNTFAGALGHTDRVSLKTTASKLESVTVHKLTSNTDNTLDAAPLNTDDGNWTGVQAEGKVALFVRGGALRNSLSVTTGGAGTLQYLVAGLAAGMYNVTIGGSPVVTGGTVGGGDNSLYFEGPGGMVSIVPTGMAPCTITTNNLPGGTVRGNYSQRPQTRDCAAPVRWSIASGALCNGLTLDATTGTIAGIPTMAQVCSFSLRATDSGGRAAAQSYALTITGRPGVAVSRGVSCTGCVW